MNSYLYASPEEMGRRQTFQMNSHMSTVSVSLATILGKYMAYKDSFELRKGYNLELETINNFLSYLNLARKFISCVDDVVSCLKSKDKGIKVKYFFVKEYAVEAPRAFNTITLLEKDNDGNPEKIGKIINDLENILIGIKNKTIKEPEKLIPYFHMFNALSDVLSYNPNSHPSCKNLDCTVCSDN